MELLALFMYIDPMGREWRAPVGSKIDGASIPQLAWSFIGGPFEGKYRDASVIHDVACDQKSAPWETVHENFYFGMLASNVEAWRAKVMYAAVFHFGPRWPRRVTISGLPPGQTPVAQRRALEGAPAGSSATILTVRPYDRDVTGRPRRAHFDVLINPPEARPPESAFAALKDEIERREASVSGGMTLEEIRAYQWR